MGGSGCHSVFTVLGDGQLLFQPHVQSTSRTTTLIQMTLLLFDQMYVEDWHSGTLNAGSTIGAFCDSLS